MLLGKMKKKGNVWTMKRSKSASDIPQGILDQKDDFCCFQSRRGTRSLSHDNIFLSEQHQLDPEPTRVHSQENIHGKIQALQMKLQMQKMHLGPPPLVIASKQTEDHQQSTEVLTLSKNPPHKSHMKSSSQGVLSHPISSTLPPIYSSAPSPEVDFSNLPQFVPCLDNSAARHRMSIKPRNQRASTKTRRTPTSDGSRPRSESMIILEQPLTESKEEDGIAVTKEMTYVRSYSSQIMTPEKGLTAPLIKGKEEPTESTTADVETKQIQKSTEAMVAKRPSSAGPTSHKGSGDHKESLYSSSVSTVSSEYAPCLISLGTEQSQPKTDKEFNTVKTHVKRNALNKNRVQDTLQEHYLQGQPLKPLSLHKNTSPLDSNFEGRHVHHISSMPLSSEEYCLQESTNQQRSLSFSVSSDESHERQRTGSFTGHMEQVGGKREHVFSLIKPSSSLKTQDLHKNAQVRPTGKDPSETGVTSTPAITIKPRDLTLTVSVGQEREENPANKTQDKAVETQEGIKEADKANKGLKTYKVSKEQKEERSASEVTLQTTLQSEVSVKQPNTEVRNIPWLPESTASAQTDRKAGPVRETGTVLRSPPLCNTECFIAAKAPVFSSNRPQSARRDQERSELNRFPNLQPSAQSPGLPFNSTKSAPVCVMENSPIQTSAKESREASTELSWMTMAREKTRSLQQLFTNTLSDLAGLQTVARPAASPLTQLSSQPSAGPIRTKHQISPAQPSVSPLETHLSTPHVSVRTTHPTQPPTLKSSISLARPSIDQSGGVSFSLKQTLSPISQIQPTYLSAIPRQQITHSATKQVPSTDIYIPPTQINPPVVNAVQQQLSQMSLHQAHPVQQSLPQSLTKTQASQCLRLSLSPKLIPHQPAHQSPSPVSQPGPLGENLSSLPLGKVDWTTMPQGRSLAESQAHYAGSLGSKALLIEQWHHQKPDAVKVVDQTSTQDTRTYQPLDEFLTISGHSKFTELAVSPGTRRLDREGKCQKKTLPPLSPSSSLHLQSNSDSRQPSWMELAKRKSMAWSDKTMD